MSKKILVAAIFVVALGAVTAIIVLNTPAEAQTTPAESGYIQINNLTVTSIPSPYAPTQIFAADLSYPTITEDGTVLATTTATVTCAEFGSGADQTGVAVPCPVPPSSTSASSSAIAYYSPYTIQIDPTTQISLSDGTPTLLGNFAPGDAVDVYGYFNSADDTIDAQTVRDLSKPIIGTVTTTNVSPAPTSTALAIATDPDALSELQNYITEVEGAIAQLQTELTSGVVPTVTSTIPSAAY